MRKPRLMTPGPAPVPEDVLLYADSDMFFIAPFDPWRYERDGSVPLFAETGQRGLLPTHERWQVTCSKLLGVPWQVDFDVNYVGQLIWWRRPNALGAVRRIEQTTGKAWQQVIAPLGGFSEYILYGLHCDRILGEQSGHWHDREIRTLCYWDTEPLDVAALETLKAQRAAHHHSVMVSSKSRTPMALIREVFGSPDPSSPHRPTGPRASASRLFGGPIGSMLCSGICCARSGCPTR